MTVMKLVSWNVNGIRAAEKKGFLDWMQQNQADIIAVQETKAHPEQVSEQLLSPDGYHSKWSSAVKKGYSGVATYTRVMPDVTHTGFNDPRFDDEGRILITEFAPFVFFNIYFPNGGRGPEWVQHKLAFYKRFLEVVGEYRAAGRPVIVAGDVNTAFAEIDLARPKEGSKKSGFLPEERTGLAEFFDAGLVDTFRFQHPDVVKYSWWDMRTGARERNQGWRIDYVFVSSDLTDRIVDAEIHTEVLGSDHCPISLTLEV